MKKIAKKPLYWLIGLILFASFRNTKHKKLLVDIEKCKQENQ